jgi:uncharacterized membrane protein
LTYPKEKFRLLVLLISSFLPALLLLALPFYRPADVPFFFLLIGRFHPLILHFPIVLIILALLFEITRRLGWLRIPENVLAVILIGAALSTLVSIAAGFFLFASGDYSGRLMEQHFWAGTITGATIFITVPLFFIYKSTARFYPLYFAALLTSNAAVGYTSNLGGSITHGPDYLSEYFDFLVKDTESEGVRNESEMLVYEDMLMPVFEAKCMSCHNQTRAKGDLLMTSYRSLVKGGESGNPSITANHPEQSELLKRVLLPDTAKDHMPPEGKTPMSDQEIALLRFWIEAGAKELLRVTEAKNDPQAAPVIESLLPEIVKYRRKAAIGRMKMKTLEDELDAVAKKLSIDIEKDSLSDSDYFTIATRFPPAPFTNDHFRELSPYYEVFSKVSLVSSGIDDDGLYYIGQMANVTALYLQKTRLDGSGLIYLKSLPNLETLNLSFTNIDDRAVIDLLKFPSLKVVYVFKTKASKQVIEALRKNKPELQILEEEGPYL